MNPTAAGPECEAIFIVAGQDGDDGRDDRGHPAGFVVVGARSGA